MWPPTPGLETLFEETYAECDHGSIYCDEQLTRQKKEPKC
jgi:hypothetical protein